MTAPVISSQALAQSTVAIESQAAIVAGSTTQAQAAVGAYVLSAGQGEEAWYDHEAITHMARDLARLVDGFSVNVARYMDDFMSDSVAFLAGRRFKAIGVRQTTGLAGERGVREGITTAGTFGRAADTYRYQQSLLDQQFIDDVKAGAPSPTELASPLDAAVLRAQKTAQLNLALAGRNQARAVLTEAARRELITGYRRVLHAELSEEGSCGLCVADSTRVHRSDHLMPMHPGCHCIPVPLTATRDPGAAINDADLARFYADAGGTSADKLRATRYKVDEHGEVGPVLRPLGEPIRSPADVRRDTNRPRPKSDEQKVRTLRRKASKLQSAYDLMATQGPDPAWKARLEAVAARIDQLDREIVRLEG